MAVQEFEEMRTLFITYHYLDGNGGGVFASRAFINAFAELSEEMTLLYPMKEGAAPEYINPKVKAIPVWDHRGKIRKYCDLCIGRFNRFRDISQYVGDNRYDVVVFDTSMVTHGIINVFRKEGCKIITIHHNYQYEYFRDNAKHPVRLPTLFWTIIYEREAVRCSDLNFTLTKTDKELLASHYGTVKENIHVVGAFEYIHEEHPVKETVTKDNFLITGNLGAIQTEMSLLRWLKEYFPLLKKEFPQASLTLAGSSPSEKLTALAKDIGAKVIDSPKDMNPILAEARYYICPTCLGGGLKLRVMDGLRAGLPILCHAVSARGYETFVENGIVFVYDDTASFQRQLKRLKQTPVSKNEVVSQYEDKFLFENGVQRLRKILYENNIKNIHY